MSSEFEFSSFFELTPDLVCIAGKDGFFKKINQAVIDKLGFTKEELFAQPVASFIYPEDRDFTQKNRVGLLSGNTLRNFVNRYVTKKGEIIWLEWTSIYSPDKEIVFAIAKDVTERKVIEKEAEEKYVKLKNIAANFKKRVEKDKKYIAYELHEELAQLVVAIKMDVEWIAVNMPHLPEALNLRIENAVAVSKMLIKAIQRISFSISPALIDELGLNATLEWLCNEFSLLNGVSCSFTSEYDEENLTPETRIDFFRVCQESLINVASHAKAENVIINIKAVEDKIQLTIFDDGKGFDVNQQKETPGLINMQERAASINGQFTIESKIGAGTKIYFTVEKYKPV